MKKPNGYEKIIDTSLNIGTETFEIKEPSWIIDISNSTNWSNDTTIWLKPSVGWVATDAFAGRILVIKFDWENEIGHLAYAKVGSGIHATISGPTIPIMYSDVKTIPDCVKWIIDAANQFIATKY